MEIQSKRKHKKRRTRRNLDELRERSRSELKDNVNSKNQNFLKMLNISNHVNNAQITSKRLTLALFNNSIRSETVTRLPYSRIVPKNNSHGHIAKENIISACSKQSLQPNVDNNSTSAYENKDVTIRKSKEQIEVQKNMRDVNVLNNTPNSAAMANPMRYACDEEFSCESSSGEFNHKQDILVNTSSSCSSSDRESGECVYEKFMNDLPNYVKEHLPVLAKEGVMNKNIAHLKQTYWKTDQNTGINNVRCTNSKGVIHSSINCGDLIIQNPMNYVGLGSSWQQRVKKNKSSSTSSKSSSPLSQLGSESSNIFVQDSPEFIYFPHKLN